MARNHDMPEIPEADCADGCAHPRHVYDLIGHSETEARLAEILARPHFHHAWLMTGPAGVGKATLAYRAIRTVLGGTPQTAGRLDVPEHDPIAQRVASLGHGDFLLIRRPYDVKRKRLRTEITVDETRRFRDFFSRKPSEGGYRVCLIDSADELNPNAANALLKTLEEPPAKTLIILLSSEPGRLLPTIRSRCMAVPMRAVPSPEIMPWLSDRTDNQQEPSVLDIAAKLSNGAPGHAFALAQSAISVLRPLANLWQSLPRSNTGMDHVIAGGLSSVNALGARALFWNALIDLVRAQAKFSTTGEWDSAFGPISSSKPAAFWLSLEQELRNMRRAELGLNMDKQSVMLGALQALRAA